MSDSQGSKQQQALSLRAANMRRAYAKALDRAFPSTASHLQVALNTPTPPSASSSSSASSASLSGLSAKELLARIAPGGDLKSSGGRAMVASFADLFVQATLAMKKASLVTEFRENHVLISSPL